MSYSIPLTAEQAIELIKRDYPRDGYVMAANYDSNGEEGEWDGLTMDDVLTWVENGVVDVVGFADWGPFAYWTDSDEEAEKVDTFKVIGWR